MNEVLGLAQHIRTSTLYSYNLMQQYEYYYNIIHNTVYVLLPFWL